MNNIRFISDKDLIGFICKNNQEMLNIINSNPSDIDSNKDILTKLFMINRNYYIEVYRRKIKVHDISIMKAICTLLGYQWEELFDFDKQKKLTKKR